MGSYTSADVKCPFYIQDEPKTCHLTCESVLPGGSIKTHFRNKQALTERIEKYCIRDFKACPWYQIVGHKWSGDL